MKLIDLWAKRLGVSTRMRRGPEEFWTICPCHSDTHSSLHVYVGGKTGEIMMKCFVCGATGIDVCKTLGVPLSELDARLQHDAQSDVKKPPLGVMPRYIWEEKRRQKLRKAITAYMEADLMVPESWIEEWNELTSGGKVELIDERLED